MFSKVRRSQNIRRQLGQFGPFTLLQFDMRRHRPGARYALAFPRQFRKSGTAQPPARHKQGDGFEQIGLATSIWPGKHVDPRSRQKAQGRVGAEIAKGEPAELRRQTRIGISTYTADWSS